MGDGFCELYMDIDGVKVNIECVITSVDGKPLGKQYGVIWQQEEKLWTWERGFRGAQTMVLYGWRRMEAAT